MDRYRRLIRKREKTLAVFTKMVTKLTRVMDKMSTEIAACDTEIADMQKRIEDEAAAIVFLRAEHSKTLAQAEKIKTIFVIEPQV